jgi:cell division protein FtsW
MNGQLSSGPEPSRQIRIWLCSLAATLVAVGVVMIFSASAIFAWDRHQDSMYFLKRHMAFLAVGITGFVCAMLVDMRQLRKYAPHFLIGVGLALLFVGLLGPKIGGARRWISIGAFNIQPSEFAKLAVILYLADRIAKKTEGLKRFKQDLLPLIAVMGVMSLLILLGKDLGTTVVLMGVFLMMLFVGGIPVQYFAWLIAGCIPVIVGAILIEPYRVKRLTGFLNPFQDIQGKSFQLYQSLLAIGSGGLFGKGLGQSQQKLFYLPAAHTDFIFAIIGEELGFIGAGAVILLFVMFGVLGMMIVFRAKSSFNQLFALGLVTLVLIEAIINIGVSTGAFPTKGLALPFISYGGSSLVVNLILVGLLLNLSRERTDVPEGWRRAAQG